MGLETIESAPKDGNPVFLMYQDTGDMTTAHWAVRQSGSFQREAASIAFSPTYWLPQSKTVARASVAIGVCVVWLFIGDVGNNALGGESNARAQAFVASTAQERKIAPPNAMPDESLLVSQVVETTVVAQKQILEWGGEKIDILTDRLTPIQRLDAAQRKAAQAPQSAPVWERKQPLEYQEEWGRAEALACAPTSSLRAELDAVRSAAEAARIKQRQALEQQRERADALAGELTSLWAKLDTAGIAGVEDVQGAEAEKKQKQALGQERDRADTLARQLTSLREELETARSTGLEAVQAAEAGKKQEQALEQERGRADTLARELTSLRTELDAARATVPEAAQVAEAEKKQEQALEQERGRADTLARELTSFRAELDAARATGLEAARAAEVEKKQEQAQERGRADTLARELTALRTELDAARAMGLKTVRTAEAAKIEQELAFGKERDKSATLARELASARKEAEARSALVAAAHAEVLQLTETNRAIAAEQKVALASERDRADALSRELTSVRNQLEAGNRQIAALNAQHALATRESAVDSSPERMAESSSRTIQAKQRLPEQQISGEAAASTPGPSGSESPPPGPQSTAREPSSDLVSKVAMATERSNSASAASRSVVDEQRLLARATTLLGRADISGARLLLEHALERGSARAAFMLAETYDARVLRSWHAQGISGDLTKARVLYERAQAGGIEDAKERIETLK